MDSLAEGPDSVVITVYVKYADIQGERDKEKLSSYEGLYRIMLGFFQIVSAFKLVMTSSIIFFGSILFLAQFSRTNSVRTKNMFFFVKEL